MYYLEEVYRCFYCDVFSFVNVYLDHLKFCFDFRGELGFLNCDDVFMCVMNKQFKLLEFVFESVYVDLQYDKISLTFTAGSVCLCGGCSPWSVCDVVVVPYVVDAVVVVTVMHVLLFLLHMCMLRDC